MDQLLKRLNTECEYQCKRTSIELYISESKAISFENCIESYDTGIYKVCEICQTNLDNYNLKHADPLLELDHLLNEMQDCRSYKMPHLLKLAQAYMKLFKTNIHTIKINDGKTVNIIIN